MKLTDKKYAIALYQCIKEADKNSVKDIINNFIALLIKNNDFGKADKIVEIFSSVWNKEEGIVEADVVTVFELKDDCIKMLNSYLQEMTGAKNIILNRLVNKEILGGAIVKFNDKVLDLSLKTELENLKISMIK